jgi:AraC family transcriptional regulator
MLKPYELLENILLDIEKGINDDINASVLSKKFEVSEGHLRRLFSFAFKQSIASYIRSRRLAASLNDILEKDFNILDIALEYGFEYEQSYIRAFRREFGLTPGDLRKTGQIIKIKPPLHLFVENKVDDGVFFGPDIVMVPQFHIIGKHHRIPYDNFVDMVPELGKQFMENERKMIKGVINPNVYIGLTRNMNIGEKFSDYKPSVQVKNLKNIPQGFFGDTFETSTCARFRYIGHHHYYNISKNVAAKMYSVIGKFSQDEQTRYVMSNDKIYFVKIDTSLYNGTTCQIEFYSPVLEKQ